MTQLSHNTNERRRVYEARKSIKRASSARAEKFRNNWNHKLKMSNFIRRGLKLWSIVRFR